MKNLINYFYGIQITEYKKRNNSFYFIDNKNEFEFVEFYGDINNLLNLFSFLKQSNMEVDEIILNNQNSFLTHYENKTYILLKKNNHNRVNINLDDIQNYDINTYIKGKINWKDLWKEKIDYYELQLEETGINYPLLKETFSYYVGLSESAINLLNYIDLNNVELYISHKRLENGYDLLNPLNIILDSKSRDIGEYIKKMFFEDKISENDIVERIKNIFFTNDEAILFLSRLIYPSYYFDMYEKIYNKNDTEENLKKITKKNTEYEVFLKKIYMYLKQKYDMPQIEFLEI